VETIPFYVKRDIARTHANPKYARGIILFTWDMYIRVRVVYDWRHKSGDRRDNEGEGNIDYAAFVAFYLTAHDRKLRKVPREFFKL
jgi:hypothetical protein